MARRAALRSRSRRSVEDEHAEDQSHKQPVRWESQESEEEQHSGAVQKKHRGAVEEERCRERSAALRRKEQIDAKTEEENVNDE